jgi:hypothetical protein
VPRAILHCAQRDSAVDRTGSAAELTFTPCVMRGGVCDAVGDAACDTACDTVGDVVGDAVAGCVIPCRRVRV